MANDIFEDKSIVYGETQPFFSVNVPECYMGLRSTLTMDKSVVKELWERTFGAGSYSEEMKDQKGVVTHYITNYAFDTFIKGVTTLTINGKEIPLSDKDNHIIRTALMKQNGFEWDEDKKFDKFVTDKVKSVLPLYSLDSPADINIFETSAGKNGDCLQGRFYLSSAAKATLLAKTGYLEEHTGYYDGGDFRLSSYEDGENTHICFEGRIYPDKEGNPQKGEFVIYQDSYNARRLIEEEKSRPLRSEDLALCRTAVAVYPMNEREIRAFLEAVNMHHALNKISVTAKDVLRHMAHSKMLDAEGREQIFILLGKDAVGFSNDNMEYIYSATHGKAYYLGARQDGAMLIACPELYMENFVNFLKAQNMDYAIAPSPLNKDGVKECDVPYVVKPDYPKGKSAYIEAEVVLDDTQTCELAYARTQIRYGEGDGKLLFSNDDLDATDFLLTCVRMNKDAEISLYAQIDGEYGLQSKEYDIPLTEREKNYMRDLIGKSFEKQKCSLDQVLKTLNRSSNRER